MVEYAYSKETRESILARSNLGDRDYALKPGNRVIFHLLFRGRRDKHLTGNENNRPSVTYTASKMLDSVSRLFSFVVGCVMLI